MVPADPVKGGAGKNREMNTREWVRGVRQGFQEHAKRYGVEIDMRSNQEQGLGDPEPKLGSVHPRAEQHPARESRLQVVASMREAKAIIAKEREDRGRLRNAAFIFITNNLATASRDIQNLNRTGGYVAEAARAYGQARADRGVVEAFGSAVVRALPEVARAVNRLEAITADRIAREAQAEKGEEAKKTDTSQAKQIIEVRQSRKPDQALEEALEEAKAYLGKAPQTQWENLVQRTKHPPKHPAKETGNTYAHESKAMEAWIESRKQRGLPVEISAERIARHNWTAKGLAEDWQKRIDATGRKIAEVEQAGKRIFGGNRNADEIQALQKKQASQVVAGNNDIQARKDWDNFKPKYDDQVQAQQMDIWRKDVALVKRIEPHAPAIIEADRQRRAKEREQNKGVHKDRGGHDLGH